MELTDAICQSTPSLTYDIKHTEQGLRRTATNCSFIALKKLNIYFQSGLPWKSIDMTEF